MSHINQIYYFLIGDYHKKIELGHYICEDESISEKDKDYIISKAKETYTNFGEKDLGSKEYKILENNIYSIFYLITSSGTFYLSIVSIQSIYMDQNNLMFEFFEDIQHQGIKKLVDKNGELTNVGKQNLKFSIEKYTESNKSKLTSFNNNNELFENTPNSNENNKPNKITMVTSQINEIKKDVKSSLKNMITNISDMEELDSKSLKIKEQSYKFQQDSLNLERKLKWQNLRNKIIIGLIILFIIIIIYVLI